MPGRRRAVRGAKGGGGRRLSPAPLPLVMLITVLAPSSRILGLLGQLLSAVVNSPSRLRYW